MAKGKKKEKDVLVSGVSEQRDNEKKKDRSIVMVISVVLNIVLLIVCIDTIHVRLYSETDGDKIWKTAVANAYYCAESFLENESDTAYYYIIGETGTLVDLLPYSSFGDNTQKKQFENLYQMLVTYPDVMRTKGVEMEEIFNMLSENDENVFLEIEELYESVTGGEGEEQEQE